MIVTRGRRARRNDFGVKYPTVWGFIGGLSSRFRLWNIDFNVLRRVPQAYLVGGITQAK